MIAVLSGVAAACRSTQLYEAFSLPPMNQLKNGAVLVSSVVCQGWSQASRSAYSLKHSGNLSSANRFRMAGSLALACATNAAWRRVVLLLSPVHRDLRLGDLRCRTLRVPVFVCHDRALLPDVYRKC